MKTRGWLAVAVIGLLVLAQGVQAESINRLGAGLNYWKTVDDVDLGNVDENGVSWLLTYQHKMAALLKLEADLEIFPSGFQGMDDTAFAPQAYVVLGHFIYVAAGVGIVYSDGDFADDPFYALRAGLDLEIFPDFYLDLNVNYRFAEWESADEMADDIDGDTLMFGMALRLEY